MKIYRKMNEEPEKPSDSECCGSGCKPCIFDVYEERLKKWKETNFKQSNALDQLKYNSFLVINIANATELLVSFKFQAVKLKNNNLDKIHIKNAILSHDFDVVQENLNIKSGEYLILKGAHSNKVISRAYTPVLHREDFEKGIFTIIISLLPGGRMSEFFTEIKTNDIVFWRGPYEEFTFNPNLYKHILLFGGGTGLVPLYNIAKTIIEDDENETWVTLIASFKSANTIILRDECRKLRDYWNFKMTTYVNEYSDMKKHFNESIIFNRLDETVIEREVKKCGDDIFIVVCGPSGFNKFLEVNCKKLEVKNIFIFW